MEDLLILTPDTELRPDPAVDRLPDGLIRPHVIRSTGSQGFVHNTASIEGIQKLVQEVWLEIISDRTVDGTGSGMASTLRSTTGGRDILTRLSRHLTSLVQSNIIRAQAFRGDLPKIEQLLTLKLITVRFDDQTREFKIDLELRSMAKEVAFITYSPPKFD